MCLTNSFPKHLNRTSPSLGDSGIVVWSAIMRSGGDYLTLLPGRDALVKPKNGHLKWNNILVRIHLLSYRDSVRKVYTYRADVTPLLNWTHFVALSFISAKIHPPANTTTTRFRKRSTARTVATAVSTHADGCVHLLRAVVNTGMKHKQK